MAALSVGPLADRVARRVRAAPTPQSAADAARLASKQLDELAPLLPPALRDEVLHAAIARLNGLGSLEAYLSEEHVTDVVVNAGRDLWVERDGCMQHVAALAPGEVETLIERVIGPLGLRLDRSSPIVDARLPDGARLCAVLGPLAVDGTCLAIRRFALADVGIDAFAAVDVSELLRELVVARCNIVVSGATSSGKTTLLNALAAAIDPSERVVTIEDTAELALRTPHVVRLEARPATPDGVGEVTMRDLVRAALRLRPDRIVVGEVRGPEAADMVHALNTGHDGSLSTIHANGPDDAIRRVAALAGQGSPGMSMELIVEQVQSSIDVVVHVARRAGGRRVVEEIAEVAPPGSLGSRTIKLADAGCVHGRCGRTRGPVKG